MGVSALTVLLTPSWQDPGQGWSQSVLAILVKSCGKFGEVFARSFGEIEKNTFRAWRSLVPPQAREAWVWTLCCPPFVRLTHNN
jgi:hypothetical protein